MSRIWSLTPPLRNHQVSVGLARRNFCFFLFDPFSAGRFWPQRDPVSETMRESMERAKGSAGIGYDLRRGTEEGKSPNGVRVFGGVNFVVGCTLHWSSIDQDFLPRQMMRGVRRGGHRVECLYWHREFRFFEITSFFLIFSVCGWHWAPCVTKNPEWAPFSVGFAPLQFLGFEISMQEPNFERFSWFGPLIFGVKKTSKCEFTQKSKKSHSGSTKNACRLTHRQLKKCASYPKKMTHRKKCVFFRNFEPPHFCTVFSTICGTVVEKSDEARELVFRVFGTSFPILRLRGAEIFGTAMCDRTAGFYHVLSVFVVLSVSVESAMECQMTCLVKCFLRCVFERYDVKSAMSLFHSIPLEKTAFGGNASL